MNDIAADNLGFVECWNEILTPKWIRFRHLLSGNGKIHSDIERGFIRVEVMKYDDLIAAGSEQNTAWRRGLDLARALASRPRLLFLDKLASGLSEGELKDMITLIFKIRDQGITILLVTHEKDISEMTRRIIRIRDGVIV